MKPVCSHVLHILRYPPDDALSKTPYANLSAELTFEPDTPNPPTVTVANVRMWRTKVIHFLSFCQELQEALLAMIHISSGSPARATEVKAYRVHNDSYNMRSIVISQSQVVLIARYAKPRNMRAFAKPILRIPDHATANRLLVYLVLVRSLECEMVRAIYGNDAMRSHWYWMFADKGKSYDASRIRNIITNALDSVHLSIGFQDYRHYTSGMVPVVCGNKLKHVVKDLWDEFSTTAYEQASHSTITAKSTCARTTHHVALASLSDLSRNRQWCVEWHHRLGLSPQQLTVNGNPPPNHSAKRPSLHVVTTPDSEEFETPMARLIKKPKTEAPSSTVTPRKASPSEVPSMPPSSIISACAVSLRAEPPHGFETRLPELLNALRHNTLDPSALFKSHMQFSVTASVLARQQDMLVLMPTGSGKTMCILLPIAMEKNDSLSTIVIVPLKALLSEYQSRAKLFQIDIALAPSQPGSNAFSDIYVFTTEFLKKPQFREFLHRLAHLRRLARVVLDEAHLNSLCSSFRPALKDIRLTLSLIPKEVPAVLLRATVPPEERAALLAHHGMADAALHTMPTVRRNLKFVVLDVTPECNAQAGPFRGRNQSGTFAKPFQHLLQVTITVLDERFRRILQSSKKNTNLYRVILYTLTRVEAECLHETLSSFQSFFPVDEEITTYHIEALRYHAALDDHEGRLRTNSGSQKIQTNPRRDMSSVFVSWSTRPPSAQASILPT